MVTRSPSTPSLRLQRLADSTPCPNYDNVKRRKGWHQVVGPTIVALVFAYRAYSTPDELIFPDRLVWYKPVHRHGSLESKEVNEWIDRYPDTPGARFVHLLRKHLHYEVGAERRRVADCGRITRPSCFGGAQATESLNTTMVPTTDMTAQQVTHLNGVDRIPRLGTDRVCLPLILAGQAIQDAGVVVEFGPFAGMTSRCMGIGLNKTGVEDALFSFDTFENENNWNVIKQQGNSWVTQAPEFDTTKDFIWVWKRITQSVYPTARPIQGMISKDTANANVWKNRPVAMLSLDSIKDDVQWQDQLAGIDSLKAGSILALQDFRLTDQPSFIYGCLRDYLMPVFSCWEFTESWIFIVKQDISLRLPCKCMKNLRESDADRMEQQLLEDLDFMGDETMALSKNQTYEKLSKVFRHHSHDQIGSLRARAQAGKDICATRRQYL